MQTNSLSLRSVIMFIIATVATLLSAGLPQDKLHWTLLGITALGVVFTYIGKSFIIPAMTSDFGEFNWRDFFSGVLVAIGTAISNLVAVWLTNSAIVWADFWSTIGLVVLGYVIKTFMTKPKELN